MYFPPSAPFVQQRDRARGALYGLAIGDALGMPTQMLSRRQITARWGPVLNGFEPAPAGHPIAARIEWAAGLTAGRSLAEAADIIGTLVGTSLATQESVPAAFAVLSAVPDDPWRACLLAASLGGDCDTIAAMAGAVGGACHGRTAFPPHAAEVVDAHGLGLADLADSLLALRQLAPGR